MSRIGRQTIKIERPVYIRETAAIVGVKEGEGPLSEEFDEVLTDDTLGEKTWEKSESALQKKAAYKALDKAGMKQDEIDYALAGDLINQCIGAHYSMRDMDIPFLGLYGACSTMTESLSIGSMLIGGGFANNVMCLTSSHFCTAEKQFRNPLEYGGQRTPSAQWTVTGSGCAILSAEKGMARITAVTSGKVIDKGINDLSNMGAAMAPAAIDTLLAHFKATNTKPQDYDLILTGDLGHIGSDIIIDLMQKEGYDLRNIHNDCGKLIFDREKQDTHAGGSGCGCCASVLCGHIMKEINRGKLHKILVMATGALMNPMIVQQGESIPCIAHAVEIEKEG
ncbi:MAG: stage V sporulation protein AD [Clostridia bacterium]|nr:stage V sporulation protein AD [Clostridia bacterium]MBQ6557784.1 stage V sporulation protein AD [Clostridia bacterium]